MSTPTPYYALDHIPEEWDIDPSLRDDSLRSSDQLLLFLAASFTAGERADRQRAGRVNGGSRKRSSSSVDSSSSEESDDSSYDERPAKRVRTTLPEGRNCTTCGRTFASRAGLSRHMQTHVTAGQRRKWECSECHREFLDQSSLSRHQKSHLSADQRVKFSCPYCSREFDSMHNMKLHVNSVHEKTTKFSCDICGKEFTRSQNMHQHKRSVHKVSSGRTTVATVAGASVPTPAPANAAAVSRSANRLPRLATASRRRRLPPAPPVVASAPSSAPSSSSSSSTHRPLTRSAAAAGQKKTGATAGVPVLKAKSTKVTKSTKIGAPHRQPSAGQHRPSSPVPAQQHTSTAATTPPPQMLVHGTVMSLNVRQILRHSDLEDVAPSVESDPEPLSRNTTAIVFYGGPLPRRQSLQPPSYSPITPPPRV